MVVRSPGNFQFVMAFFIGRGFLIIHVLNIKEGVARVDAATFTQIEQKAMYIESPTLLVTHSITRICRVSIKRRIIPFGYFATLYLTFMKRAVVEVQLQQ